MIKNDNNDEIIDLIEVLRIIGKSHSWFYERLKNGQIERGFSLTESGKKKYWKKSYIIDWFDNNFKKVGDKI